LQVLTFGKHLNWLMRMLQTSLKTAVVKTN
jgi:hypothetical protein